MYEVCKRIFDLAAALAGLILSAPILVAIAIVTIVDSGLPVIYRGRRVGRYGKLFDIYKFRTMHVSAEASGTTTAKNDPRITRIGGFLRRYKLDELPQLVNVLKGQMSMVGPRPEVEEHTSAYTDEEKLILTVLPGITDYSSIRFVNLGELLGSENPHELFVTRYRAEKNQLRLKYVQNRSFSEDIRIIVLTLTTIFRMAARAE